MFSPYLKKPIKQVTINFKALFCILLSIIIFFYCNKTYSKTPEQMIQESIAQYPGKCPCPYSIMSNGKKCGKRSAYSKPGGYEPLCYISDIKKKNNNITNIQEEIRIIDGDTIHINKFKYRLHGIDAPEMKQLCKIKEKNYKCGIKSKDFLVSLIGKQSVKCNKKDIDRYKRIVAECFVGQTNLNKELVRNGWALAYRDYSKDYIVDEEFAQENNLGLWKGTFIHPKKWRKQNR
ncbi:MAG: thermonuclease family protein [Alphaproteobacteria bacterium]